METWHKGIVLRHQGPFPVVKYLVDMVCLNEGGREMSKLAGIERIRRCEKKKAGRGRKTNKDGEIGI